MICFEMRNIKLFKQIPGPLALPIVGSLWKYILGLKDPTHYHNTIADMHKKYGQIVKETFGKETVVHVFSPDDVKTIYSHEGKMPYVTPLQESLRFYREVEKLPLGLGNSNGEEWYRLRNSIKHLLLTQKGVGNFTEGTDIITKDLIKRLQKKVNKDGKINKLRDELSMWSLETAGLMCFGKRLGYMTKERSKHVAALLVANKAVFYWTTHLKFSLPIHEYMYSPIWNELYRVETLILRESIENTNNALADLKKLIAEKKVPDGSYTTLLTLLNKENITENDIYILMQSLFTDGLSTTVPNLLCNLHCLATHKNVQQRAFQEITKHIKGDEPITASVINNLSYIKCIIKETFRFYPIGTEIARIAQEDMVLSNYEIAKGTCVNINMNVHLLSEKYFEDSKAYKPERWLRLDNSKKINPFVLTPFGHGARTCIGRRFAEQNQCTIIARLLKNFEISLDPSNLPMDQVYNVLMIPLGSSGLRFIPRK